IPIRKLEANRDLMKVEADDKLAASEKAAKVAEIKDKIAKIEQLEKQADNDPFQKRVAAFVAADKARDKDTMHKMIAEFAAGFAGTNGTIERTARRFVPRRARPMTEIPLLPAESSSLAGTAEPPRGVADDVAVPAHSLARRARGWTLWVVVIALLIWSW